MGDTISIVESAYLLEGDDEAWLQRICEALRRATGGIAFANFVDATDLPRLRYWAEVSAGFPPGKNPVAALARTLDARANRALFEGPQRIETISERLQRGGVEARSVLRPLHKFGVRDILGMPAMGLDGRGCGVALALPKQRRITEKERARWEKVAAHLGAGHRLRGQVARDAAPEAVLRADGYVEEASPAARSKEARQALRDAARAVDKARAGLRRSDPDAALNLWKGLVAGRWSLVDAFERDGRRYLLARRNEPRAPSLRALTAREAQVAAHAALGHTHRLIAYELGLAASTVATHLAAALRKLGAKSRLDLAPLIAAAQPSITRAASSARERTPSLR